MSKKKGGPKGANPLWWVAGIAVVVVGALIGWQMMQTKPASNLVDDRKAHGKASAKVTLIEFGDYL